MKKNAGNHIINFLYDNANNMYTVYQLCNKLNTNLWLTRWYLSRYFTCGIVDKIWVYKDLETETLPSGVYYGIKL